MKKFSLFLILILGIPICLFIFYCLIVNGKILPISQFEQFHEVGDAIGGISAPFIGLVSALLVFYSFREQYKANELLINARKEDNTKAALKDYFDRIETKYERITDLTHQDLGTVFREIVRSYNKINEISEQDLKENGNYIKSNSYAESAHSRALSNISDNLMIIRDFTALFDYCRYFNNYLIKSIKTQTSDESKDILSLYISEYAFFLRHKIEPILNVTNLADTKFVKEEFKTEFIFLRDQYRACVNDIPRMEFIRKHAFK